jgi:hypothetical protein
MAEIQFNAERRQDLFPEFSPQRYRDTEIGKTKTPASDRREHKKRRGSGFREDLGGPFPSFSRSTLPSDVT